MKKFIFSLLATCILFLSTTTSVSAGWVNGYFKSNGTYVQGYYRTEPDYYKWNNYSFDNDWNDAYNDKSWYRDYGYDPEPYDNDYPNYDYWSNSYNSYDYDYYDYDYSYDDWWDY